MPLLARGPALAAVIVGLAGWFTIAGQWCFGHVAGELSDDGQRVLLVDAAGIEAGTADVALLDRTTGETTPVGEPVDAWTMSLNRDGRTVAWTTAEALGAGDDNGVADVYVTRRRGRSPHGQGSRPVATDGRSAFARLFQP